MVLRKDYLVRMIEEMVDVIFQVFGLKQQNKLIEALWKLDDLYREQFGLNSRMIGSLSARDIVEIFRTGGKVEADKLQSLARLLQEEGDIYIAQGRQDEGIFRLMKSLHLYLAADLHGADHSLWDLETETDKLLARLRQYRLPADTEHLLLDYEEAHGRFDKAEDALYRLLELEAISKEQAVAFYERLLQYDPERLSQGGLPLDEVREGLAEVQRR
ncbi:DUF6483 family protein [Paenibacillus aceti]|uniref:Bacterial transcriptional activator domain-containing protein n=1 Tax=Paenibacillus aceti TaxID=1820010 RepID=A0ABQ1W6R5_9BACL|nr:DUF6483 family protein [Paenibacillus aceti]GGG17009.1 hypothetical protein GCM10010913_43810 [Paenibacillus aceti]